jgi:hypothetical protein
MRTIHLHSLAAVFAALTLTIFLSSCGTMGDSGGTNDSSSSNGVIPYSSSGDMVQGACQVYDEETKLTMCVQSTILSAISVKDCEKDEGQIISKCATDNYALKCLIPNPLADVYIYGNLPSGTTCYNLGFLPSSTNSSSSVKTSSSSNGSAITDDPNLVRRNITLSSAGNSYADIDGNVATYNRITVASRLDKIDLIAYCGWCEHNSIYSPWEIDLFWTDDYDYLGGDVFFFEIPNQQATIFKTATKLSEITPTLNSLIDGFIDDFNYTDEIPTASGKVFFVITSESNYRIVIIKQVGSQSVDLEIIEIPGY